MHPNSYLCTFASAHALLHPKKWSGVHRLWLSCPCSMLTSDLKWPQWLRERWSHHREGSQTNWCISTFKMKSRHESLLLWILQNTGWEVWAHTVCAQENSVEIHNRCESSQKIIHKLTNTVFSVAWMCNSKRDTFPSFNFTSVLQMTLQILTHSLATITSIFKDF